MNSSKEVTMPRTEIRKGDRFLYKLTTDINSTIREAVVEEITINRRVKLKHINIQNAVYYEWYDTLEKFDVIEVIENLNKKEKLKAIKKL